MRKLTVLFLLASLTLTAAHAKDSTASVLIGTWEWHHIRHESVVTYKADGTYERQYSHSCDDWKIHSDTGTWKIEGDKLIEVPSKKGSAPISSVIEFQGKNRFQLEGFMLFERLP